MRSTRFSLKTHRANNPTTGFATRTAPHSPHTAGGFRVTHAGRTTFHIEYNVWVALSSLLYMVCPSATWKHKPLPSVRAACGSSGHSAAVRPCGRGVEWLSRLNDDQGLILAQDSGPLPACIVPVNDEHSPQLHVRKASEASLTWLLIPPEEARCLAGTFDASTLRVTISITSPY